MLGLEPTDSLALSLHHAPGTCAVLVGSGLSRAAGIPTGWEITLDLVRRLAALKGVTDAADWAEWYRNEFGGAEPNYSTIIDALAKTAAERRALLHRYIEPENGDDNRKPTQAHRALARLVKEGAVRVILTTNFDRLIENALRDEGIEPTVITDEHGLAGATPLTHATCTIIKLHGDYLDTRIKNTDAELAAYHADMDRLLDRVFDEYGLMVVGWSGEWDTALRQALLRASTRRYPLFWASRGPVAALAQDIIDHRQGQSFAIVGADQFLPLLADKVAAVRAADRVHPVSVTSALALAKRYCREDRYEAEWAEFLEAEAEKVRAFVRGSNWSTEHPTADNIRALVAVVMARTEVLRRAALLGMRWGVPKAQQQVIRTVTALTMSPSSVGGFTVWNDLRDLPASLCFYWALAGALDGRHEAIAAQLLLRPVALANRTRVPAAQALSLWTVSGSADIWNGVLNISERQGRAPSLWLEQNLVPELADIAVPPDERLRVQDEVEAFLGMEFSYLRKAAEATSGLWAWFPVGQFVFRDGGAPFQERLQLLENLPANHPWLKYGLFGGTAEGGKLAAANARETLKRR